MAGLFVKMQYIIIELNLCEVVQFLMSCIAWAHLMTIYTRDFERSYIISVLKKLIACLHTWRSFWRGFAFGEDLLHISGTTWPVLSSRSSSSSGVTLSMPSLLESSPKASPSMQSKLSANSRRL